MLNSMTLLRAMGGIGEAHLSDTAAALGLTEGRAARGSGSARLWRTVLIAAVLAALLTACAVGISIHQRRQWELRERYEVEEKNVGAWVDNDVPQGGAAASGEPEITLLSQYNDGVFCTVFVNVSPVEESEIVTPLMQETFEDGWSHRLEYRSSLGGDAPDGYAAFVWDYGGEYGPEDMVSGETVYVDGKPRPDVTQEARLREMKKQCYDPATKTLTLSCPIPLANIGRSGQVTLELALWDVYQRGTGFDIDACELRSELRRSFGTVSFEPAAKEFRTVRFDEPPEFFNEERGKYGRVLGVDISASKIIWHIVHEEQAAMDDGGKRGEGYETALSWSGCVDRLLRSAVLGFGDGTSLPCGGALAYGTVNGELEFTSHHTAEGQGEITIDIHKLSSVTIAGQTFELPAVADIRG